jgi:hypothetical protein
MRQDTERAPCEGGSTLANAPLARTLSGRPHLRLLQKRACGHRHDCATTTNAGVSDRPQ